MWSTSCSPNTSISDGSLMTNLDPACPTSSLPTVDEQKKITQRTYDETAVQYATAVADLQPEKEANQFLSYLPAQASILDLGCGSGRDARTFSQKGFNVTGIDFSTKLIEIAKEADPQATFNVMDIEAINFPDKTFEGVWANNSLLHISKETIPSVLNAIFNILKDNGIFFLSLKEGSGEAFEKDRRYGNYEKYWSYFQRDEIVNLLLANGFQIIEVSLKEKTANYETHPQIRIWCKKS